MAPVKIAIDVSLAGAVHGLLGQSSHTQQFLA
jgi:hypothetical protein